VAQIAPRLAKPGPAPECSDSEFDHDAVGRECWGWDVETDLMSSWQEHPDLFPRIPTQGRFNRRRRNLTPAINLLRQALLAVLDLAEDRHCAIDSLPIPVVQFHLVPGSTGDWRAHGATFGKVSSKKMTIFGYKLHLLMTLSGLILDFELAPANLTDLAVGSELLEQHTDLAVCGDKGYISAQVAARLLNANRLRLLTLPRVNQKIQVPPAVRRTFNAVRQIIETVNGQLTEQFHIEHNHAHTFRGLCARLITELTAHTLCIYLNRLLGKSDFLQIKALAFPI
jgi:hypothetical protein